MKRPPAFRLIQFPMKPLTTSFAFLGMATLGLSQTTVRIDGSSGNQTYSVSRSTSGGGLTLGLDFEVEYLVVGGGGSGGTAGGNAGQNTWGAGGGGAGGFRTGNTTLVNNSYTVVVGAGGVAPTYSASTTSTGIDGGSSQFGDFGVLGGGGGAGGDSANGGDGRSGASGGGGGSKYSNPGGSGTAGQGFAGGSARGGNTTSANNRAAGGGGGGAGGAGGNAASGSSVAGAGGAGLASSITGTSRTYAGGGGGGARDLFGGQTLGAGGSGGGGAGSTTGNATSGTDGLGGGGGGSGADGKGGDGGDGIVIVRYKGPSIGAGTGGTIESGTGSASGYTLHTFTTTGTSALNLSGVNLNTRLGAVQNGVISGNGDFSFTGPGKLTLNATNTYTGTTRVNGGTLALGSSGSIGTSAGVSLASGSTFNVTTVSGGFILGATQTLSGGGTIEGDTTIAGTHTPGFSPGLQTFTNNLSYSSGSSIVWELNAASTVGRGTTYDAINVGGDLTFTGAIQLTLNFSPAGSTVDWSNSLWDSDITGTSGWKIFEVAGDINGLENLQLSTSSWVDSTGKTFITQRPDASFTLYQAEDGVYLNYSAVPEPGSFVLVLLSGLPLLRRKRLA